MRVGLIGTGLMGVQIANRLLEVGYDIYVHNRTRSKTAEIIKNGGKWIDSPKELGDKCSFALVCVTDGTAFKQVCLGNDGLIRTVNKEVVIGNLSTISPADSAECSAILRKNGIQSFQIPVMGGPDIARKGDLVAIISGDKNSIDKNIRVIESIARSIFYVGKIDGAANYIKLALNMNIALIGIALSESILYIKKAGIDPGIFIEIFNSTYFKTSLSEKKGPRMVNDDFEPRFHLRNMLKDLQLLVASMKPLNVSLPFSVLAEQMYQAAKNRGYSELDYTAILAFLQDLNGMRPDQIKRGK
jgi:3-hydroxyisobutyrate dehydrogenase-like beta-hydroxyacid dehydrogenase